MKKKISYLLFLFALIGFRVEAQTPAPKPAAPAAKPVPKASPNDELIKLQIAGMDESILLATVAKTGPSSYDTSADALLKLKSAGVSQRVIAAVLGIAPPQTVVPASAVPQTHPAAGMTVPAGTPAISKPAQPTSTQQVNVSLANEPSTVAVDGVTEAGIYLQMPDGKLEQLEPAVYSGTASKGKFLHQFVTPLVSQSDQAVVRSLHANQRIQNSVPVFYFFFEKGNAGLSNTGGTFPGYMNSASSPNEFVLVRMKESKDERQITVAKTSSVSDRVGVPSKDTIDVKFRKVKPGVYEVHPSSPLTPGEYCFFYQGGSADKGGTGKLFDFGVDPGSTIQ